MPLITYKLCDASYELRASASQTFMLTSAKLAALNCQSSVKAQSGGAIAH